MYEQIPRVVKWFNKKPLTSKAWVRILDDFCNKTKPKLLNLIYHPVFFVYNSSTTVGK